MVSYCPYPKRHQNATFGTDHGVYQCLAKADDGNTNKYYHTHTQIKISTKQPIELSYRNSLLAPYDTLLPTSLLAPYDTLLPTRYYMHISMLSTDPCTNNCSINLPSNHNSRHQQWRNIAHFAT